MPTGEHFGTNVPQTTMTAPSAAGNTAITVNSSSQWPATPFTAVLGIGTSLQEAVYVTNVSGVTWTATRGYAGTISQNQPLNQTVTHADVGVHFTEFRSHLDSAGPLDASSMPVHGLTNTAGNVVVGTKESQTLTNKSLTSPTITTATFSGNQALGSGTWSGTATVLAKGVSDWINVKAPPYSAVGDGVADDTTAINNALIAAGTGGTVFLPAGTYKISSAITFPQASTNLTLRGNGPVAGNINSAVLGATIIKPAAGAQYDAIVTTLPPAPGNAGYVSYGTTVADLAVDMANVTGTTTGKGNGVHFYGVRYGRINNVHVFNSPNYAFLLEGDNPTNFSYNVTLVECIAGNCAAGVRFSNSEQGYMLRCVVEGANASTAATQPYSGTSSTTNAYMLYMNTGWIFADGCTFGSLGTGATREAVFVDNGQTCIVRGCLFDGCRSSAFHSTAGNHIFEGNSIENPCAAGGGGFVISLGAGGHVISDNVFHNVTAANFTYCIGENGAYAGNNIHDNFLITGATGTISLNAASTPLAHHNVGYNPVGNKAPGVPLTTVAYQNQFGTDATVHLVGGTVTVVAIGGVATGATTGTFRVPANQTITLTYTVAPTWKWFLD